MIQNNKNGGQSVIVHYTLIIIFLYFTRKTKYFYFGTAFA